MNLFCNRFLRPLILLTFLSCISLGIPCEAKKKHRHKKVPSYHSLQDFKGLDPYVDQPLWMKQQIASDLEGLKPADISSTTYDQFLKSYAEAGHHLLLVRYVIKKQVLSIHSLLSPEEERMDGVSTRLDWMNKAMEQLTKTTLLPDVDFIVSLHDSLDINLPVPIFVFAKNPKISPSNILIPDFEALRGHEVSLYDQANKIYPWSKKNNLCFFRGSLTGPSEALQGNFLEIPRVKAVTFSHRYPNLIDARITCGHCKEQKAKYPDYFGSSVTLVGHWPYKYQLLVDGNSCAYSRAYWQLFSNCVIIKQISDNIQWYYGALKPFEHYIPVNNDLSDLIQKMQWAHEHDEESQQISQRAQTFAKENLTHYRVMQYLHQVLVEYANIQSSQ